MKIQAGLHHLTRDSSHDYIFSSFTLAHAQQPSFLLCIHNFVHGSNREVISSFNHEFIHSFSQPWRQWMNFNDPSIHLPTIPSICPPVHDTIHLSIRHSIFAFTLLYVRTSFHSSVHRGIIYSSIHPSIHPSKCPSISPPIMPSFHSASYMSVCHSIHPLIHPSTCPSVHPSTFHTSIQPTKEVFCSSTYLQYNLNGEDGCEDNVSIGQNLWGKMQKARMLLGFCWTGYVTLERENCSAPGFCKNWDQWGLPLPGRWRTVGWTAGWD